MASRDVNAYILWYQICSVELISRPTIKIPHGGCQLLLPIPSSFPFLLTQSSDQSGVFSPTSSRYLLWRDIMHGPGVAGFGHYNYYHPSSMVPLHFCYQFYACLFVLTLFGGISVLALALMTLYEIGGVELVFALCLSCFYGLLKLMLPPWPDSNLTSYHHHQQQRHAIGCVSKMCLAIDTYCLETKAAQSLNGVDCDGSSNQNDSSDSEASCCPICLVNYSDGDFVTQGRFCGHLFHEGKSRRKKQIGGYECLSIKYVIWIMNSLFKPFLIPTLFLSECLSIWLAKSPSCPYCRCDFEIPETETKRVSKNGVWGIFDGVFDSIYLWWCWKQKQRRKIAPWGLRPQNVETFFDLNTRVIS